jgi:arabinose-5-phosphate isomerase
MKYADHAREVIRLEAEAVAAMAARLDDSFEAAVGAILECRGRVIVSGMGKSGLIGRKIAATLNSTGIASFFLHPAEALHGDLGLICADDVIMIISKSGQLNEMETVIAAARRLGVRIIGLCGTVGSPLDLRADISLDCSVATEACPNNLIPTSSSTAALVMGDALALSLLKARDFSPPDFAQLHPGGVLGRRLLMRVSELHHTGDELPLVNAEASMSEAIVIMTGKRLGCVVIKDEDGRPAGIFTDGDLRRLVEKEQNFLAVTVARAMIENPKTISQDAILDAALALMEKHSITSLPTVDGEGRLAGLIHLHDILKSKLV